MYIKKMRLTEASGQDFNLSVMYIKKMRLTEASGKGFNLSVMYIQENATDRSQWARFQPLTTIYPQKMQLPKASVWKVQPKWGK